MLLMCRRALYSGFSLDALDLHIERVIGPSEQNQNAGMTDRGLATTGTSLVK